MAFGSWVAQMLGRNRGTAATVPQPAEARHHPLPLTEGEQRTLLARVCAGERFAAALVADFADRCVFTRHERDRLDGGTDFEGAWFDQAAAEAAEAASPQNANPHTWKLFIREETVADLARRRSPDRRKGLRTLLASLVERFADDLRPAPGLLAVQMGWQQEGPAFLVPSAGHVVFSELHEAGLSDDHAERLPITVVSDGRRGYIDLDGRVLALGEWEQAEEFHDGLAAVRQASHWGFIRRDGEIHIPLRYDEVSCFCQGLAKVRTGGKWGVVDSSGEVVLPCENDVLEVDPCRNIAYAGRDGRFGLLRLFGQPIIDFTVTDPAIRFGPGVPARCGSDWVEVSEQGLVNACRVMEDGRKCGWGFLHVSGREAVPFDYDQVMYFADGLAVVERDTLCGCVDADGRLVIPLAPRQCYGFSEEMMAVSETAELTSRWGYVDRTGKLVIPFRFDSAEPFHEGLARVAIGDCRKRLRGGFIDLAGNFVIPWTLGELRDFHEGLAAAQFESKWGFIDRTGAFAIDPRYDAVEDFRNGLARVKNAGRYGLINAAGTAVVPIAYDYVSYPTEGLVCARRGERYGYLDERGHEEVPFVYEVASPFHHCRALVKMDGLVCFLRRDAVK